MMFCEQHVTAGQINGGKISSQFQKVGDDMAQAVAYPGILFGGEGVQQIQLRTEDGQNGDLGAVAP